MSVDTVSRYCELVVWPRLVTEIDKAREAYFISREALTLRDWLPMSPRPYANPSGFLCKLRSPVTETDKAGD